MKPNEEGLSIRKTEAMKLENVNKTKKEMQSWGLYRYPTPTKKVKSLSLLRKKLIEFFERTDSNGNAEDLPTPTQLAVYIGYPSAQAMYKDINNPSNDPEYAQLLDRAVDLVKDNLQRRQLRLAESRNDWQGVDAILQRMDKAQERAEPQEDKTQNINVNISIEKKERIQGFIDDRLSKLMADAEYVDVNPKELPQNDTGSGK